MVPLYRHARSSPIQRTEFHIGRGGHRFCEPDTRGEHSLFLLSTH